MVIKDHEMIPFVNFDGKNMNKIIYLSVDVTPVLTVQEGGNASIDFSENPVSVKAYIADYEADIPSLHALKELSNNKFDVLRRYMICGILRSMLYFLTIMIWAVAVLIITLTSTRSLIRGTDTCLTN